MNSLVIYASHKGNTRRVAERITAVLAQSGSAQVCSTDEAPDPIPAEIDLVVIGGPTEGHGMTPEVVTLLDRLERQGVRGRRMAAFDTRLWWPRFLSGSAGDSIAERLRAAGAELSGPVGSFIVTMKPELQPGELERAADWATTLAASLREAVPAGR